MATKRITATPQRTDFDFDDFLAAGYRVRQPAPAPAQAAEPENRTWGQAVGDTAVQLAEGVNTTLGAVPSIVAPDGTMAGFFRDNADYWRDKQSEVLKQRIAATDQRIQEAGKEGVMSQIGTAVSEYWNDPAQAARLVATNLPSMAATLGTGALAGATAKGVAAARGLDAANKAALAAQYGTRTAMATNAALNAGGARGEAYEDLKRTALAQGMSQEQAEQAALDGSILPGVVGGVAGAISGKLGLEKALLGQPGAGAGTALRRSAGAFGAELAGEQIEEVAPKITTNYEAGKIDPARSLTDDLGRTMVETTIGAGPGALVAGGVEGMNTPAQAAADAIRATEKVPESGALTKAVNAGVEAKAQAVEAGAPVPTQPGAEQVSEAAPEAVDDPVRDQILALPDGARQDALRAYAVVNRTDVAKGVQQYNRKLLDRLLTENAPPPVLGESLTGTDMGTMLGGGGMTGNADPLAGALGMGREAQANSITNVASVAERRPPMPASDAARMLDEARNQGVELAVAEHPAGGFVLVPPNWVTPDMAAQGEARLNETIARMQQADAAPVERAPRTRTDGVGLNLQTDPVQNYLDNLRSVNTPAARAYVRDFDAGRITPANVQQRMTAEQGKTPDQLIAQAAAEAPSQTDPVADRLARAAAQGAAVPAPTDILNPVGLPFKTRMAADRAAKQTPGAVVPVEGGFVVRPQEPVNVQDVPQAPEVPQAAPAISQPGQAPQAVGAQPAGPAAGVPAEGAGAVEAAGVEGATPSATPIASTMAADGWAGETGSPDDTFWMKQVNGETYTARLIGDGMEVTVPVDGVSTQIGYTTTADPAAAAKAASKAVADDVAASAPATHSDPGQKPEAATPGVVTDSLKKAARNEDTKPSEMRKWLVGKIDEAIAVAPEAAVDFLSFDVPGDGAFKVQNSQARLQEFRKKVMASPGFKDGGQKQNTKPPEQVDSAINGSGSTVEALRNFLADGDVQGAIEFAKLKGVEFTPVEPRASMTANGKFKRVPASVKSSVPSVAEGLTQVEAEQINQYLTAEKDREEPAATQDADEQQSPQDFIPAPDGGLDYGEITPEMGKAMRRQAGKIRLQHGVQNSNGTGWGLVHIEANHGKQISGLGFGSVQDFVAHVASSIQQVWQVPGNSQLLLTLKDGRKDVMYIQLEIAKEGDFYRVNSAFPVRQEDYESLKGMKKIWDGSEPTSAVTGQRPAFATAASASPESESSQGSSNARGQDASVPPTAPAAQPDTPKLTPTEAKSMMAWEDLGQKDGVKTHALTFYESQADKDAKRGRMIVAKVSKGDRSATAWMVDGEDKTFGMLAHAKKLAEEVGMAKAVADGFVEQGAPAPANDRNAFTLQRLNRDTGQMESLTFERGEYVRHRIAGKDHFGEIDGISHARREFSVDGLWYAFGFANKAERPAAPKADTVPLSSVIAKVNAKNGQGLTDADRVPEQKPVSKTPTVDRHNATMAAVREGKATAEQFRASFEQVVDGKAAIVAELDTMTKVQLLREGGPFVQMRYANEKKADVVDAMYREMVGEYALGETVSYGMGKGAYEAAVRKMVEATDADKLANYVAERKAAMEEMQARRAAKAAAIENPQTLADFREVLNAKIREGMTRKEAFLTLTPDQRIQYDTLEAESTREAREARKRAQKTEVRSAGQTTAGEIIATKHTRDGYDLFVVKLADRLSADDYKTVLASAKKLGGWYSAFRGNGAIPGFQFKDKANAEAFLALAGGDTTAAQEQVAQRRDAFEDDRSQTAVERLRAMADKLESDAAEIEGLQRKTNTERRARFAASALKNAAGMVAKAKTMRNIAQALEDGKATFLDSIRTKSQVEMLSGIVGSAKVNELRAEHQSYADVEKRIGEPPTAKTADFADFPSYGAFRSDLATLGRQMLEVDGTKKLGQRLMSAADDVTDAYLEFAKANFRDVSQFGRGDAMADFASKDEAERAIKRSGLTGKAIVLPIKRGQNRVILSPGEAIGRGVWKGDGDKRITLTADFGAELVEAIGRRGNKQNQLSVPWQFQTAYDRRKALARIGIETASEFRAALREFIALKEQAVANRTRELELQMVGRKADGLDFFPTSADVADQMIEAADLTPDMAVLEPSAGMGHLADRIREAGAEPDVIEISSDRRELLEEKGYTTQAVDDFLDLKPRGFFTFGDTFRAPDGAEGIMRGANGNRVRLVNQAGDMVGAGYYDRADLTGVAHNGTASGYDRIIMNPPFSGRRDAEHVRHAYSLLKPGGRIVAIMGEGVFFGQDKKAQDFREWLESVGGTSEKLPEGSFMDPSLPVNTSVNARMVVIDKPAGAPAFSRTAAGLSPEQAVAMFNQATPPNPYPHKLQATLAAAKHGASAVQADNGGWLLAPKAQAYTAQELQDAQQRIDKLNRALKKHNNVTPAAVLSDAPTPAMAWGRSIARTLGYNVTFIQPNPDFHGVAVGGDAFVSASADHPEIGLIGHEVLHSFKQSSPDIYQALAERIRPYLKDGVVDAKRRWEDANGGRDTSMAHAEEEVLADLNGAMWLDPKFWREMAKNDQSLFRQVAYKFMEVATKAMQGLSRFKADSLVTDVDAVREIIAQEWAYQAQEMGNPSEFAASDSPAFSRTTDAAKVVGDTLKSITVANIKQRAGFKLTDYLGIGLQALGRRQIVDIYGDLLPLTEYNRLVQQMEADKNEGGAEADQLVTRWAKLDDEAKLAGLMHEATLAQIDPDKPFADGDDKGKFLMLERKFTLLSDDAKAVYRDTRDAYKAHHAKVRSAIKERIERSEIKGERKAALLKQMDDEFFAAVKGVYFPLARFGQYAVTVKGPDGKVESVSRAEGKAEAEALRNNLLSAFPRDKGFTVGRVMLSKEFVASRDAVGRGFMTELYQVLDKQDMDAVQRAELEDTLGQLYLSSLPDLSWAKHGIHRKGTPGFSQDARRAYAQNMFHGARYLAKLRYSDLMQDELGAMQKHVDDWREVEDFDQNSAQRVVDEMNKRHESLMNPKSNALSTALTSLGFVFHLGLSPASAMVNLSQTALVAYPIMGAKWGFGKASAALLKASAEAAKGKNDITASLNEDERAAYDEAVRAGTIDVTMAHDLAGIAQGEDAGVMWKIRPVMRYASFLFHHAERFNRQVTFVAAYRLAREAGAEHKAAFEQATKATYDGHFDYSAANKARIMQGNVAKVLLLFKQYGQNMVYTLARNAQQAIKGESPEARAQARKSLGGLLATHAAAAGVLGLPMVTTLLAAASMIGGDDDEPWDAKVALQNMLADTFGQKAAEVMAHGLSRLTPWDISGRVGLDRLIFPDVQEGLEGQRLWESAATQALGPVGGIFGGALKGLDLISDGHYQMGLEAMLPAVLRQAVKSVRYATDGAQDKSGVSIKDEVSTPAVVGQLLGFSPSEVRLAQEGKSAVYQQDRALGERRQELLTKAARATMAKDAEARAEAMKEIQRFNQKNPTRRITPLNVLQSVRNSQRRIDQAEGGVYLPKNRRDAIQAGRFALAESE